MQQSLQVHVYTSDDSPSFGAVKLPDVVLKLVKKQLRGYSPAYGSLTEEFSLKLRSDYEQRPENAFFVLNLQCNHLHQSKPLQRDYCSNYVDLSLF